MPKIAFEPWEIATIVRDESERKRQRAAHTVFKMTNWNQKWSKNIEDIEESINDLQEAIKMVEEDKPIGDLYLGLPVNVSLLKDARGYDQIPDYVLQNQAALKAFPEIGDGLTKEDLLAHLDIHLNDTIVIYGIARLLMLWETPGMNSDPIADEIITELELPRKTFSYNMLNGIVHDKDINLIVEDIKLILTTYADKQYVREVYKGIIQNYKDVQAQSQPLENAGAAFMKVEEQLIDKGHEAYSQDLVTNKPGLEHLHDEYTNILVTIAAHAATFMLVLMATENGDISKVPPVIKEASAPLFKLLNKDPALELYVKDIIKDDPDTIVNKRKRRTNKFSTRKRGW